MQKPPLIAVYGPTAVGKTALAVNLALEFNGEVISADSRQFYRQISIGTAKPTHEEMKGIPHHFIDSLDITESYTAGRFAEEALAVIEDVHYRSKLPIVAGGSGLYMNALLYGLNFGKSDEKLRNELNETYALEGIDRLRLMLKETDEERYSKTDLNNPVRIIRALEIAKTGDSVEKIPERPFRLLKIGLSLDRILLYERINRRVDNMMSKGLVEEARSFFQYRHLQAFNTVGYKEMFSFLEGLISLDRAAELIKQNSRRYAKRQLTWMRSETDLIWFDSDDTADLFKLVKQFIDH